MQCTRLFGSAQFKDINRKFQEIWRKVKAQRLENDENMAPWKTRERKEIRWMYLTSC
jgi:hypothetical protein